MTRLPDGWYESAERIAWHCAKPYWRAAPLLGRRDRYDVALDAIVELVADYGWPAGDLGPVYRAAGAAIKRASERRSRDLRWWSYWYPAPGTADAIAEAVSDKIGVRQVVWILTEDEWAAIWATAEVMARGGGTREAAALLGISDAALKQRLLTARRKCRGAWVAPGETAAARVYQPTAGGRRSRYQEWTDRQRQKERQAA